MAANIRDRVSNRELVRGPLCDIFYHIDQPVGHFLCPTSLFDCCRRIDRDERRVQPTSHGSRIIEITALGGLGDIFIFFFKPVRNVDVRVHDNARVSDFRSSYLRIDNCRFRFLAAACRQCKADCGAPYLSIHLVSPISILGKPSFLWRTETFTNFRPGQAARISEPLVLRRHICFLRKPKYLRFG